MMYRNENNEVYLDTNGVQDAGKVVGCAMSHIGYGDFQVKTPHGTVLLDRADSVEFPGKVGRAHLVQGPPKAVAMVLDGIAALTEAKVKG